MALIDDLINELSEEAIREHVRVPCHSARKSFGPIPLSATSTANFDRLIADYYNHHLSACEGGARVKRSTAVAHAKAALRRYDRNRGIAVATRDGLNDNMQKVISELQAALEREAEDHYTTDTIDRYVDSAKPSEWREVVEQLQAKLRTMGVTIPEGREPHDVAHRYRELIVEFIGIKRHIANELRRTT